MRGDIKSFHLCDSNCLLLLRVKNVVYDNKINIKHFRATIFFIKLICYYDSNKLNEYS